MFITDKENPSNNWFVQQENKIIQDTKDAYNKGIINTFCWHLREPYNENSFYASDMTDSQKSDAFKSLLPGGKFNDWYKKKLDKVASIVSNLKDNNGKQIPIIFRPFHEFDGNWFWWGANYCTAEEYISVYRFTVNYLRDTKNVHNILFAFSPDNSYTTSSSYLSRYPETIM
jgi:mannan endo-1,4-beta-mannosidase